MIRAAGPDARAAAAAFLVRHQALIRRRLRHKLSASARRLFDSEDLFSTVARRIDQEVEHHRMKILDEEHLWAFIRRIGENCITDRLREDAAWRKAQGVISAQAAGLGVDGETGTNCEDIRQLIAAAPETDRQLLVLRVLGAPMSTIGNIMGLSETAVRKRWERFRERSKTRYSGQE
jgi:DNA-directed RNA polymerase specialized sigma24 family protein